MTGNKPYRCFTVDERVRFAGTQGARNEGVVNSKGVVRKVHLEHEKDDDIPRYDVEVVGTNLKLLLVHPVHLIKDLAYAD